MQKVVSLLSVLVCFIITVPSFAQLNIKSEQKKVERIGTLRSTYAYVYVQDSTFFLNVRSSNQFDDPTLFFLGETTESAIMTLNDLCEVCESLDVNASISVEDAKGQSAFMVKKKMLGKPYLDFSVEGQAGASNLTLAEFKKAIEIIQSYNKQ
ncbi:MAG: hypothetical protein J6Y06_08030 [Bacteroidales bacterium]|nr:hypothetical protein [Bacteroidales bacterium]